MIECSASLTVYDVTRAARAQILPHTRSYIQRKRSLQPQAACKHERMRLDDVCIEKKPESFIYYQYCKPSSDNRPSTRERTSELARCAPPALSCTEPNSASCLACTEKRGEFTCVSNSASAGRTQLQARLRIGTRRTYSSILKHELSSLL